MAYVPDSVVNAIIQYESSGNPRAVSPKGAKGLGQFIPETGARYGLHTDADFFDPQKSIAATRAHLSDLYDQFGNWDDTFAAYNAGAGAVASGRIPQSTRTDYVPMAKAWVNYFDKGGETTGQVEPTRKNVASTQPAGTLEPQYSSPQVSKLMSGREGKLQTAFTNVPREELDMLHQVEAYGQQLYQQAQSYSQRAQDIAQTSPLESPEGQWGLLAQLSGHPDLAPIGTNILNQYATRQNAQFQSYQQSAERALAAAAQQQTTAAQTLGQIGVRLDSNEMRRLNFAREQQINYNEQANRWVDALDAYNTLQKGQAGLNRFQIGQLVFRVQNPGVAVPRTEAELDQTLKDPGLISKFWTVPIPELVESIGKGEPLLPQQFNRIMSSLKDPAKTAADRYRAILESGLDYEDRFGSRIISNSHVKTLDDYYSGQSQAAPEAQPAQPGPVTAPAAQPGATSSSTDTSSMLPLALGTQSQSYLPQYLQQTLGLG